MRAAELVAKRYKPRISQIEAKLGRFQEMDLKEEGIRRMIDISVRVDLEHATKRHFKPKAEDFYPPELRKRVMQAQVEISEDVKRTGEMLSVVVPTNCHDCFDPLKVHGRYVTAAFTAALSAVSAYTIDFSKEGGGFARYAVAAAAGLAAVLLISKNFVLMHLRSRVKKEHGRIMGDFTRYISEEAEEYLDGKKIRGVGFPAQYRRNLREELSFLTMALEKDRFFIESLEQVIYEADELSDFRHNGAYEKRLEDLKNEESINRILDYMEDRGLQSEGVAAHLFGLLENVKDDVAPLHRLVTLIEDIRDGRERSHF